MRINQKQIVRCRIFIYALVDPQDDSVRYVGYTDNLKRRLIAHNSERNRYNSPKSLWIRDLHKNGLKPEMIVLEILSNKSGYFAERREKAIVKQLLKLGADIFNKHHNPDTERQGKTLVSRGAVEKLWGEKS